MYCECITNPIRNQNFVPLKNLEAEETPSADALGTCAEVGELISPWIMNTEYVWRMPTNFVRNSVAIHSQALWDRAFKGQLNTSNKSYWTLLLLIHIIILIIITIIIIILVMIIIIIVISWWSTQCRKKGNKHCIVLCAIHSNWFAKEVQASAWNN